MPSENILTRVFGANAFAVGEVVHVTGNRAVQRAQANIPGNLTGAIGLSLGWTTVFGGVHEVLLEAGLAPVAGQVLYVSAALPGRAMNVAPVLARGFATILDASMYSPTNPVVVCVLSDAPDGAADGGCCPSGIDRVLNAAVVGPAADGVTDHTYALLGATATILLPPSNAANRGRRITVNLGLSGGTATVTANGADVIQSVVGGPFVNPSEVVNPFSAGPGLSLVAVTWQADGLGAWYLFSNHVFTGVNIIN